MVVVCPSCQKSSNQDLMTWDDSVAIPHFCPYCDEFNWVRREADEELSISLHSEIPLIIPPIELGSQVYIDNNDHEFHLERGKISDKDHWHYRILFSSLDDRINGTVLWMPQHWIKAIPQELA